MTPGDWLLEQFEAKLEDYKTNGVFFDDGEGRVALDDNGTPLRRMGLGSVRYLIELKDDMEEHGYPYCHVCKSWDKRWPKPKDKIPPFPIAYGTIRLRARERPPGPYLRLGLPPV